MLLSYHECLEKYGTDYRIKKTYRKVIYLNRKWSLFRG